MPPKTERFEIRLEAATLERIDNWASRQSDRLTRSDAVRRLIERGLEIKIDDGDRLLIMMMRDIHKSLKIKDPEINPDFVADAIEGGHHWALEWELPALFHNHVDDRATVNEVVDILDMWTSIEEGYENASITEKSNIEKEAYPFGGNVKFLGFDGNNEFLQLGIAQFLVEKMGRFMRFKGREMNSHCPIIDRHRRMFAMFEPIRCTLIGRKLSVNEIIKILNSPTPP